MSLYRNYDRKSIMELLKGAFQYGGVNRGMVTQAEQEQEDKLEVA